MIKDYILSLDCDGAEGIWDAAVWDHDAAVIAADADDDGAVPGPVVDPVNGSDALLSGTAAQKMF